jgi:hypothetical protein
VSKKDWEGNCRLSLRVNDYQQAGASRNRICDTPPPFRGGAFLSENVCFRDRICHVGVYDRGINAEQMIRQRGDGGALFVQSIESRMEARWQEPRSI